jgi:DNA-binding NarL/FixJ family response regulator
MVGVAADGMEAIKQVATLNPNFVLLNVSLPVMDGISTARKIRHLHPRIEIVFLSGALNEDQLRESLEAGARGFLLKDCDIEQLIYAIKKAANGD